MGVKIKSPSVKKPEALISFLSKTMDCENKPVPLIIDCLPFNN